MSVALFITPLLSAIFAAALVLFIENEVQAKLS